MLNENDNVGNAITDIKPKQLISYLLNGKICKIMAEETIPFGFKIALRDINKGEPIIKYGEIIGQSTINIPKGHLVHVHNMEGRRGRGDLKSKY